MHFIFTGVIKKCPTVKPPVKRIKITLIQIGGDILNNFKKANRALIVSIITICNKAIASNVDSSPWSIPGGSIAPLPDGKLPVAPVTLF